MQEVKHVRISNKRKHWNFASLTNFFQILYPRLTTVACFILNIIFFLAMIRIKIFFRNETATPLDISVVNISFLLTYIKLYYKVHDIQRRVKIIWRKRQWRKYWTFLNRFFKKFLMFSTDLVKQRRANHWQYLKSAREQPT